MTRHRTVIIFILSSMFFFRFPLKCWQFNLVNDFPTIWYYSNTQFICGLRIRMNFRCEAAYCYHRVGSLGWDCDIKKRCKATNLNAGFHTDWHKHRNYYVKRKRTLKNASKHFKFRRLKCAILIFNAETINSRTSWKY